MHVRTLVAAAVILTGPAAGVALAQATTSTQATSPGQSGASNTIPQAPSGGRTGADASSGAPVDPARQADQDNKAETQAKHAAGAVCKGC